MTKPSHIDIAIIGGGPGGLALARLLAVRGIAATVFELDADASTRGQGGSLDLHTDGGLRALELAGLTAGFERHARYDDQDFYIYDPAGARRYAEAGLGGERPEIDRGELRALLLDSLPAGAIAWGKRVTGVAPRADGGVDVICAGEPPRRFDLVVGADGTWSRVRPILSDTKPVYSGVAFVQLEIDAFDTQHPDLARLVPHGKMMALGERKVIIAQRNARENLRVYAAQLVPEAEVRELAARPIGELKAELLATYAAWAPELRALIERSGDHALVLPIHALPIGHTWPHKPGVTLLGDAAHVMSPFAGEGVNNAMRDALELALALTDALEHGGDWDAAIARYERDMFARVVESASDSATGIDDAVAPDALDKMIALARSHRPEA